MTDFKAINYKGFDLSNLKDQEDRKIKRGSFRKGVNNLEGKLPKVYQVTSIVKEFSNYKEVPFSWFLIDRKKSLIPYKKGIMNYVEGNLYSESAIDELFINQEAKRLVAYLEKEHKDGTLKISIDEQKLPIANNIMGYCGIAVGDMTDFYTLDKEKNYNLPFKVWGYFNLRNSKTFNMKTSKRG